MKRIILIVAAAIALSPLALLSFAEDVRISVPAAVGFSVTNVGVATNGTSVTTLSFNQLNVTTARVLRISIKADGNFVPPGGTAIPASKVSWTTSSASNGTGNNGTLSTSAYTQLFQSALTKKSGSVNIAWTLGAPGVPLRAGNHTLTVRWKLESIAP